MGRDGAIHIVSVDHSGPPPAPFVRARASVSMRAVAWASQQTLVTAGTTGKPPSSTTSGHDMRLYKLLQLNYFIITCVRGCCCCCKLAIWSGTLEALLATTYAWSQPCAAFRRSPID